MTKEHTPKPSDRFIPWYFVGVFVLLIVMLVSFAWIAIKNYTGEVGDDPYKIGQHYNQTLERAEAQEKLGWKGTFTATPSATDPLNVEMHYRLVDAHAEIIPEAHVHITWKRPTQEGFDQSATLSVDGKGEYTGTVKLPLHGVWNVYVHVIHENDELQQSQTIVLP